MSNPSFGATRLAMATTGIGSLPHHNIDAALEYSFQMSIPFLPQIPIRNPWEYMIAQALEGMPGLQVEQDASASLSLSVWTGRAHAFNERLLAAFACASKREAYEAFEPSSAASSCWQPFLWELEERKLTLAKLQLAGPMTAQWAVRLDDGSSIERHPEIADQVFRLVLARTLAMARRLQRGGIQPVVFLDEPGLYGLSTSNPRHVMGLQELKLVIQALRKDSVLVGLHCCSNTDWGQILQLGLDVLSIDTSLSLAALLDQGPALETYIAGGGRLSLGVIPTSGPSESLQRMDVKELFAGLLEMMSTTWSEKPELVQKVLRESMYTPACGLALHSPSDAETILSALKEFRAFTERAIH